jgi:glucose dehydrogenase
VWNYSSAVRGRFRTIPLPSEPGGNTWNGLPTEKRSGGSSWTPGSYDADLNLVYFGPAPSYDTGPLRIRSKEPGVTNDALYSDSTIALNPDTGKLVWYFQHVPNDQWITIREVLPHVPDAWISEQTRDKKDAGIGRVGYEVALDRYDEYCRVLLEALEQ